MRNGWVVKVTDHDKDSHFPFIGRDEPEGCYGTGYCWQENGKTYEGEIEHDEDIVEKVSKRHFEDIKKLQTLKSKLDAAECKIEQMEAAINGEPIAFNDMSCVSAMRIRNMKSILEHLQDEKNQHED